MLSGVVWYSFCDGLFTRPTRTRQNCIVSLVSVVWTSHHKIPMTSFCDISIFRCLCFLLLEGPFVNGNQEIQWRSVRTDWTMCDNIIKSAEEWMTMAMLISYYEDHSIWCDQLPRVHTSARRQSSDFELSMGQQCGTVWHLLCATITSHQTWPKQI